MREDEIASDGWWHIPAERYKTRQEHVVPLGSLAHEIIKGREARKGFVFYSPDAKCEHIRPGALSHALQEHGLGDWTPHDLRRTVRTRLSRLGVPLAIAERVLGHGNATEVERAYDWHEYRQELERAVSLWDEHLRSIVAR